MNKFLTLTFIALITLTLGSCKKDETSSSQSLNKTTLTNNKDWYSKGGATIHIFKSNGVYSNTGSWKWKNGSDTMEIVTSSGGFKTYWKFYWNTDSEMSCQKVGTSSAETYKTQMW